MHMLPGSAWNVRDTTTSICEFNTLVPELVPTQQWSNQQELCGSPCSIQRSALYIGTKLSVRQSQSTVVGNECESSAFIELSCLLSCEPSKHTKLMDGRWCTPVGQSRDQCNHTSAPGYSLFYTLPEPMP